MRLPGFLSCAAVSAVLSGYAVAANVSVECIRDGGDFRFKTVPPPAANDAASGREFVIVRGERDGKGGALAVLTDGRLPGGDDEPRSNFFFRDGGRLSLDLGRPVAMERISTYSRHSDERSPQVYKVYGATGETPDFQAKPTSDDLESEGWKLIAEVDTRQTVEEPGGCVGVSITGEQGKDLGTWRYLLFDVKKTDDASPFADTFFSEIDVVESGGEPLELAVVPEKIQKTFRSGPYTYTIDATLAPDLLPWAEEKLLPVVQEWYPKIIAMLPSEGFKAADKVLFEFRDDMGETPAYAAGSRIAMKIPFFREQLDKQACGAVVHEMVHVVQAYGNARRRNPNAVRAPRWVSEGIPDYIRWFLYEPEAKGAEITERNFDSARYDSSYRVTANFLDWVVRKKDKDLIRKLNAASREGKYDPDLWKLWTGSTLEELGEEWRKENAERLGIDYKPSE